MGKFTLPKLFEKTPLAKEGLVDPVQLRALQVAKEHKERFEKIVQRLLDVVIEEKVTVIELPVIVSLLTNKINAKIDKAEIERILKLNHKE